MWVTSLYETHYWRCYISKLERLHMNWNISVWASIAIIKHSCPWHGVSIKRSQPCSHHSHMLNPFVCYSQSITSGTPIRVAVVFVERKDEAWIKSVRVHQEKTMATTSQKVGNKFMFTSLLPIAVFGTADGNAASQSHQNKDAKKFPTLSLARGEKRYFWVAHIGI